MSLSTRAQSMIIPSATVILLHKDLQNTNFRVLLLKRNSRLATHGGSWVFPGGKFDHSDYQVHGFDLKGTESQKLNNSEHLLVAKTAAAREVQEEANLKFNTNSLRLCSTWLTPESMPKRFNAYFFIAESDSEQVTIDGSEIHDYQWLSPQDALHNQKIGKITLPPPTFISLSYLVQYRTIPDAIEKMSQSPMHFRPKLVSLDGGFCSLYEEDAAYLNSDLNTKGPRHRLLFQQDQYTYLKESVESP